MDHNVTVSVKGILPVGVATALLTAYLPPGASGDQGTSAPASAAPLASWPKDRCGCSGR